MTDNSYDARAELRTGDRSYEIFRLDALQASYDIARLPFSLKILLENLLRNEDGEAIRAEDIEALATWNAKDEPSKEIAFTPARVVMQDFTGVPAVVDLAAMRDAMSEMGGDPAKINPLVPAELVIDHSVQVDVFGTAERVRSATPSSSSSATRSATRSCAGARGRFENFKVVPPDTGIVHQVNLEYLARVVFVNPADEPGVPGHARRDRLAYDDDQRARRARLGRGRDRGRGGDARPTDVDADPAGARLQAHRRAPGGRNRDRPRPHRHRDAPPARSGRQVRRVPRRRPGEPAARRPRDDRQHVARVRLDLRDLPDRRRDAPLPRVLRPPAGADRSRRGVRQGAGPVARRVIRGAHLHRRGSSST